MMFNKFKRVLFEIRLAFANEWERPLIYAASLGLKIGPHARFTGKIDFGSEPFLISIGERVTLANGVMFVTHDGGVGVLRQKHPHLNVYGRIMVGNNVFIGATSILLPGVTIGDNVVVGAGSVVARSIPANSVAAGVPARVIRTLDDYERRVLKKGMIVDSRRMDVAKPLILEQLERQS